VGAVGHLSSGLNSSNVSQCINKEKGSRGLTCIVKNKGRASASLLEVDRRGPEVRNHFCDVETVRVLAVTVSGIKEMLVLEYIPGLSKGVRYNASPRYAGVNT
jgi:hypothetical protein